jgi:hypothetical protein
MICYTTDKIINLNCEGKYNHHVCVDCYNKIDNKCPFCMNMINLKHLIPFHKNANKFMTRQYQKLSKLKKERQYSWECKEQLLFKYILRQYVNGLTTIVLDITNCPFRPVDFVLKNIDVKSFTKNVKDVFDGTFSVMTFKTLELNEFESENFENFKILTKYFESP